jgi:hypothetical protein
MRPMTTFDPNVPCRIHDRVNDKMFDWRTRSADKYRQYAKLDHDGLVWFDGLILDGWEPIDVADGPPRSPRTGKRLPNRRKSPFP